MNARIPPSLAHDAERAWVWARLHASTPVDEPRGRRPGDALIVRSVTNPSRGVVESIAFRPKSAWQAGCSGPGRSPSGSRPMTSHQFTRIARACLCAATFVGTASPLYAQAVRYTIPGSQPRRRHRVERQRDQRQRCRRRRHRSQPLCARGARARRRSAASGSRPRVNRIERHRGQRQRRPRRILSHAERTVDGSRNALHRGGRGRRPGQSRRRQFRFRHQSLGPGGGLFVRGIGLQHSRVPGHAGTGDAGLGNAHRIRVQLRCRHQRRRTGRRTFRDGRRPLACFPLEPRSRHGGPRHPRGCI